MDVNRLSRGEQIAGIAGILLLLIMFIFDWYGVEGAEGLGGINAWETFSFIDILIFLAAVAGIGLAVVAATSATVNAPVALSAVTAGLGILAAVLILFRIIVTPDYDVPLGGEIELGTKIGVWLGLIAAVGVAYGGWAAMQEEGRSFGDQADRLQDRGAPPPPPPPAA
jgi:hypothetical protein